MTRAGPVTPQPTGPRRTSNDRIHAEKDREWEQRAAERAAEIAGARARHPEAWRAALTGALAMRDHETDSPNGHAREAIKVADAVVLQLG